MSEKFKSIVEEFEPATHQFFPVDLVTKSGDFRQKMYLMIVGNRIDSLHREKTEWLWAPIDKVTPGGGMWMRRYQLKNSVVPTDRWVIPEGADLDDPEWYKQDKLVFDEAKISERHLWIEKHLSNGGPIISDELHKAFLEAKLIDFGASYREQA